MPTPRQQLDNLIDAMVEDILSMSDDEIRQEYIEDGFDPDEAAKRMSGILDQARMTAALRQLADPDNWAEQVIDGTREIVWAGDPDMSPVAIAETGLGGPLKKHES